jgi:hypothetical protein
MKFSVQVAARHALPLRLYDEKIQISFYIGAFAHFCKKTRFNPLFALVNTAYLRTYFLFALICWTQVLDTKAAKRRYARRSRASVSGCRGAPPKAVRCEADAKRLQALKPRNTRPRPPKAAGHAQNLKFISI